MQTKTFTTKARAEAWVRQVEGEMDHGAFASQAEAQTTTMAQALDRYAREISSKKKSGNREIFTIRWWQISPLGARSMASIRGKDVAAALAIKESEGASPHTIHLYLALLSHLFTVVRKQWGMEGLSNPAELVQKPRLPPGRDRRLRGDEQTRLLAAAQAYGGEIGAIITWAIETAMRRGEIAAMRWEHLDAEARVLLLPETKNGTARRVPLSSMALMVLATLPRRPDGRVWGMRPESMSQALERVCKGAGNEENQHPKANISEIILSAFTLHAPCLSDANFYHGFIKVYVVPTVPARIEARQYNPLKRHNCLYRNRHVSEIGPYRTCGYTGKVPKPLCGVRSPGPRCMGRQSDTIPEEWLIFRLRDQCFAGYLGVPLRTIRRPTKSSPNDPTDAYSKSRKARFSDLVRYTLFPCMSMRGTISPRAGIGAVGLS